MFFGYYRNFLRLPLSQIPRWAWCCLILFVAFGLLQNSHVVPRRFDDVLAILAYLSGGPPICYLCYLSLNNMMKTGAEDEDKADE